jgi:recombination protein RecA
MQSASVAIVDFAPAADVAVRRSPATLVPVPGVKPASALEVRPAPEMVPFGIAALDTLTGGVPRGALTEMIGRTSSGRTSITMALMAEITRRQEVCAVIDATDSFDPVSAEAAGVDLKRMLWVRCGKNSSPQPAVSKQQPVPSARDFATGVKAESNTQRVHQAITGGCFEAARGRREPAVSMNSVAPPAKNISWSIHENYDARLRHAMVHSGETRDSWSGKHSRDSSRGNRSSNVVPALNESQRKAEQWRNFAEARKAKWHRLDQALKATDLLIQSGGFGLIVIDLGDVSPEQARRIPLTSWFRFRRAVENTPTILLLLARDSCAKTCASLVMDLSAVPRKSGEHKKSGIGSLESGRSQGSVAIAHLSTPHVCLLDGLNVHVQLLRTRLERKPVRSLGANLETRTLWKRSG